MKEIEAALEKIRAEEAPDFDNIFVAFDNVVNDLIKANKIVSCSTGFPLILFPGQKDWKAIRCWIHWGTA